ncbi:MAG: DNA-directed RNA polymerase subunit beta, partial [Patescibacteria group bacterium]|nr:DNA-directed RNA polymerase subunit beta [Patescibacteria group bacterium]
MSLRQKTHPALRPSPYADAPEGAPRRREQKYFSRYRGARASVPNLVEFQLTSFEWLRGEGLRELFKEFSPIVDYSGKKFELSFTGFELGDPKYDEFSAKEHMATFDAPLRARVLLLNKALQTEKEQEIFLTDFPLQTSHGTFIINGIERVIVPQLARSFGAFFPAVEIRGRKYFGAKIVPARGVWVEFESDPDGAVYVRIDRKRKLPATSLLRALGAAHDKDITVLFRDHPTAHAMIQTTLGKDPAKTADDAFIEIYKRLRDGDLATVENAREFLRSIFSAERYDLSPVGRFKMNERFGRPTDSRSMAVHTLTLDDCATLIRHIAEQNATPGAVEDDIDHLGLRRVRTIGEMLQQRLRVGMTHMKRNIQNRMSTIEADATLPIQFINPRPLQARVKEFYTTNQLSQFMQQENILSEVEHLRTVSALGPGGLSRERAGYEVRDVHYSHYGRLCPIHTPEGPNIGLVLRLTPYARLNDFGMI